MKTKKLGLISVIVLAMVFLFALNASAVWYTCTVTKAGPGGSTNTYVNLTDTSGTPAFTNEVFLALATRANEILAIALTAMSNNMTVSVNLTSPARLSTINAMYLVP